MKIAYVLVEHLPAQIEEQYRQVGRPILITSPMDPQRVYACSAAAHAAGVRAGDLIYQARWRVPMALVVEPDEPAYYGAHETILAALRAYTEAIEVAALGEYLLDVRAIIKLHDGPVALAQKLAQAVQEVSGLSVRVGLAEGRFVAEQAAYLNSGNSAVAVPEGEEALFVAPLPFDVLPQLPKRLHQRLKAQSLYTLGDLARLGKAAVMRQFGGEISGFFELARGRDDRFLNYSAPTLREVRSLTLDEPSTDREHLRRLAQHLAWRLHKVLTHRGFHAQGLKLTLHLADNSLKALGRSAKPPTSAEDRLKQLASDLLIEFQITAPVTCLELCVYPLRPWFLSAHQLDLKRAGIAGKLVDLENAIQQMVAKFGERVVRVASFVGQPSPQRIQVKLHQPSRTPSVLFFNGEVRVVLEVQEPWLDQAYAWDPRRKVDRQYYRVLLGDNSLRKIYQDRLTGHWYLDRTWPMR